MQYFGYGAMANERVFAAVVGHKIVGKKAFLPGYHITTQRLEHVPDAIRPMLEESWGDDFRTYTIMKANHDEVVPIPGMLYELSSDDRAIVLSWELVTAGWFRDERVEVVLENGACEEAVTEVIGLSQLASGEYVDLSVDPLPLLNDFTKTIKNAKRHRAMLAAA